MVFSSHITTIMYFCTINLLSSVVQYGICFAESSWFSLLAQLFCWEFCNLAESSRVKVYYNESIIYSSIVQYGCWYLFCRKFLVFTPSSAVLLGVFRLGQKFKAERIDRWLVVRQCPDNVCSIFKRTSSYDVVCY